MTMNRGRPLSPLPLLLAILMTLGGGLPLSLSAEELTLVYSGNLDGELEPCGCSEAGNLGGIMRRASKINELRKKYPEMVLLSTGGLLANRSPRDRLKNEFILRGLATLNYDAIALQWQDLSYGVSFLQAHPLPWVASNWLTNAFPHQRRIRRGEVTMSFFAWLTPEDSPFRKMKGEHRSVFDDPTPLQRSLAEAKQRGMLTLLATTLPVEEARKQLSLEHVDILLQRSAHEKYGKPLELGPTLVLQPGSRGMRLGKLTITVDEGGRITTWQHEVIPLPESVPNAPSLKTWYDEYNAKVKAAYLAAVEKQGQQHTGLSPYTGAETCRSCHEKSYEIWRETAHAQAFAHLEEVGKAFDPDCIVCHTVGFEQPGGFIDTRQTLHLADVQCESCHGPGRLHAESAGEKSTPSAGHPRSQICGQCHTQPHSPEFNIEAYWKKIKHP